MRKWCEVVFYSGDGMFPAYYLIDRFEGETMEKVLKDKLASIIHRVREMFDIGHDVADWNIHEALYVLEEDGLTLIKDII